MEVLACTPDQEGWDPPDAATLDRETLLDAIELDRAGNALDLRLGRLLAVIKRMDVSSLGFPSFGAFCNNQVEWHDTRIRDMIRLVESPFSLIRAAVVSGKLAPSVAIRAIHEIDVDSEALWLQHAIDGTLPKRPKRTPEPVLEWTGEDAKLVHAARMLCRLHLGQPVPDDAADRRILACWRANMSREKILYEACADPPAPAPLPAWLDVPDPADALVGEWCTPSDVAEAVANMRVVQLVRRDRVIRLGCLLTMINQKRLYRVEGCSSMEGWVFGNLSIDIRTVHRLCRVATRAQESGLDLDRVDFLDAVATDETRAEWEQIVPMVGLAELARVRVLAKGPTEAVLRGAYLDAYKDAYKDAARKATKSATSPIRRFISLAATLPPPPAPRYLDAHPDLPKAARWYLERGRLPRQKGIGRIKVLDHYTCFNPECGRRCCGVEVHHLLYREHGGSDERWNLITLCKSCHLRLVHSGHLSVEARGKLLVFRFCDREIWMSGYPGLSA